MRRADADVGGHEGLPEVGVRARDGVEGDEVALVDVEADARSGERRIARGERVDLRCELGELGGGFQLGVDQVARGPRAPGLTLPASAVTRNRHAPRQPSRRVRRRSTSSST